MSCIKKYKTIVIQHMWLIVLLMILAAAYYHWFGSIENCAEIEWFGTYMSDRHLSNFGVVESNFQNYVENGTEDFLVDKYCRYKLPGLFKTIIGFCILFTIGYTICEYKKKENKKFIMDGKERKSEWMAYWLSTVTVYVMLVMELFILFMKDSISNKANWSEIYPAWGARMVTGMFVITLFLVIVLPLESPKKTFWLISSYFLVIPNCYDLFSYTVKYLPGNGLKVIPWVDGYRKRFLNIKTYNDLNWKKWCEDWDVPYITYYHNYIIMTSILVILIVVLTFAGKRIYAKKQNISQQGFWNWQMPLWAVGGLTCIAVIQWLARLISCIRQVGLIPSLIFFGNILFTGRTCMSPWYAERLEENSPDIRLFWYLDNNNVYGTEQLYLHGKSYIEGIIIIAIGIFIAYQVVVFYQTVSDCRRTTQSR